MPCRLIRLQTLATATFLFIFSLLSLHMIYIDLKADKWLRDATSRAIFARVQDCMNNAIRHFIILR